MAKYRITTWVGGFSGNIYYRVQRRHLGVCWKTIEGLGQCKSLEDAKEKVRQLKFVGEIVYSDD